MKKKIYTVEHGNISPEQWENLLILFDDATIYQTWSIRALNGSLKNLGHTIVKKNGIVVSIAQVTMKRIFPWGCGVADVRWGPLWHRKGIKADTMYMKVIIDALVEEYARKRSFLLRIWPNEHATPYNEVEEYLLVKGFCKERSFPSYRTLLLDIMPDLEDLRRNLKQKWRNQLNKAIKNSLLIKEGTSDDLYRIFLRLQKEMQVRKSFSAGVNYELFGRIQHDLPCNLKMKIFVCYKCSEPICATICSAIGNRGIYILGASGDKGLKMNGSNLLQWRCIEWLKERGCKWFDLGGIDPENNPGVYRFKKGIAGKSGQDVYHIGQFDLALNIQARFLRFIITLTRRNTRYRN